MSRPRVLGLPRTVGREWKIEAPGCVVYLRPSSEGGTVVDVEADGDRYQERQFADTYARRPRDNAAGVLVSENAVSVRVVVAPRRTP